MTTIIHSRPRKHGDRQALLSDVNYFANELVRCLESLADIDATGRLHGSWQQAAALTRRVRSVARHEADEHRRKAKQRRRADG